MQKLNFTGRGNFYGTLRQRVDGYFKDADVDDNGTVTRGKLHVPVEIGMRQIADKY